MSKKETKEPAGEAKRPGRPATGLTQKHLSFRCDLENIAYLNSKPNKGGFLNRLLREARARDGWGEDCAEMPPESDEYQP